MALLAVLSWAAVYGETNSPAVQLSQPEKLKLNAGADLRVRQEIMHNVPGLPGAPGAMMPAARKEAINHIRYRPRVWGRADFGNFGLYMRLADEMREHIVKHGQRRDDRSYNFPDEIILDNLYLEGLKLFDEFLDFRIGRQDLFDGQHSVLGLDHLMLDGAPYVGSRSCYADMARFTLHPADDQKLDLFALYDDGRNDVGWASHGARARPMNAIHPGDSPDMDEWGGGAVWSSDLFEKALPYQLYAVHKRTENYRSPSGVHMDKKQVTALGARIMPQITDEFSLDFEGARQFGEKARGSKQAGGTLGYAAADFHPHVSRTWQPFIRPSAYYLSGDKHRTDDAHDNDTSWDPMWARAPCDSELFQYGTLYGLGYWSNIIYTKLTLGAEFGPHHRLVVYSGPLWAAAQDHLGHADGSGDSMFKGLLSSARYDFPIRLAPKAAQGWDRFEIFGHLIGEVFNPGDYYDTSKPAYFIRWEFTFKF